MSRKHKKKHKHHKNSSHQHKTNNHLSKPKESSLTVQEKIKKEAVQQLDIKPPAPLVSLKSNQISSLCFNLFRATGIAALVFLLIFSYALWQALEESKFKMAQIEEKVKSLSAALALSERKHTDLLNDLAKLKEVSGEIQLASEDNRLQIDLLSSSLSKLENRKIYMVKSKDGNIFNDIRRSFENYPEKELYRIELYQLPDLSTLNEGDLLVFGTEP